MSFKDDEMSWVESDISKIQVKPGMYISYLGTKGALHLGKELVQNAIDEAENKNSPCKNIKITLDTLEDSLTVEDDGRGIPEDRLPMDILCTKLQAGSKFTRSQGGKSAGENGVGSTAVNALSSVFEWSSYRDGKCHSIKFNEGVKIKDEKYENKESKAKGHGCIVKFSPSVKYLGKTAKIPKDQLTNWVESISYFIPDDCKIVYEIYKGMQLIDRFKYKKRSITDLLKSKISGNVLSPQITLSGNKKLEEILTDGKKVKRDLDLDFTFVYTDAIEPWVDSYCNYVNTTSGGTHLDSVRESIWRYLMKKTNESMTDREKEKYGILKVDIEAGLNIIVNLSTDMQMSFVGQTKDGVSSEELISPIKEISSHELDEYFNKNKSDLTTITKIIKLNCKARIEMNKVKNATIKKKVNKFDKHNIEHFTPCNNEGKAYKELHLCEGDSAKGGLVDGRYPDFQAFYALRGVTANAFKKDEHSILDNSEWNRYVMLLQTDYGSKFDINKCYYDKIIIETDGDIDGHGITSGICAFHALRMPGIVEAGKLYKAVPPLYKISMSGKTQFVRDKTELVEVYQDKIVKSYKVKLLYDNSSHELNKHEMYDFIYNTYEYPEHLSRISKHFGVNKFLIEIIAAYIILYGEDKSLDKLLSNNKFMNKLLETVQNEFPEITLKDGHTFRGVIDGRFQSLVLNERFIRKIVDLKDTVKRYGYSLLVSENKNEFKKMSIGMFLDNASKYTPKIVMRYKGLGEMSSEELHDTTLNPDNRILIQLTMDDVQKSLDIFRKLHGQGKKDIQERKKMMSEFRIKREDLDN